MNITNSVAKIQIIFITLQLVSDILKIMPEGSVVINEDILKGIQSVFHMLLFITISYKLKKSKYTSFCLSNLFTVKGFSSQAQPQ